MEADTANPVWRYRRLFKATVEAIALGGLLSFVANPWIMSAVGSRGTFDCGGWVGSFYGFPLVQYRYPTISSGGLATLYWAPFLVNTAAWSAVAVGPMAAIRRLTRRRRLWGPVALALVLGLAAIGSVRVSFNAWSWNMHALETTWFVADDPLQPPMAFPRDRWAVDFDSGFTCRAQ